MFEPGRLGQDRMDLAGALRRLRRASGLSGERLAARTLMSQAKISRIETGKTVPTIMDVERILSALDVPLERAQELLALAKLANIEFQNDRQTLMRVSRTGTTI